MYIALWLHFLSDFILQSDRMALNKSSSWKWLGIHCVVYALPFALVLGWRYAVVNAGLHFIIDAVTSRVTTHLWKQEKRHAFFTVIGLDQALHLSCLVLTMGIA